MNIAGDLRGNDNFRHPIEPDDLDKYMYDKNGKVVGTFIGLEYNGRAAPRVKYAVNETDKGFTYLLTEMYVEINPSKGGKSRRRQTKKTRRGKPKRKGRKTRGRRR